MSNIVRSTRYRACRALDRLRNFIQYNYAIAFARASRRTTSYFTSKVEVLFARAKQARFGNRENTRVLNIKIWRFFNSFYIVVLRNALSRKLSQ